MSNSNRRPEEDNNNNAVTEQVKRLLKDGIRGKIPTSTIIELRKKYNDDNLLDKIQEVFYEKLNEINSRALKFAKLIEKKFGAKGLPLHIVLKESKRYKEKYDLDDIEFNEFTKQYQKLINSRLPSEEQGVLLPNTNMAQLFGDVYSNEGLIIKDSDYPVVQEIIKMYTMTRGTHSSVILQSMQYSDCPPEVMHSKYDPQRHNTSCAIHPVIAAMFIPKIKLFEEHFLYTNIAYIIKSKYSKEQLNNMADINLLYHMINDANDIVCSADTPLKDIKLRCNLQNNLWNNVLALRSGRFYDCVGNDFFTAIDECKISMYDAPDLLYIGDEGVILKRLIAAFSFRPIVVSTTPIFGTYGTANPVNFPVISNRVVATPLLTLRLPSSYNNKNMIPISLESAISQSQVYLENGMFVPKTQEVIYTNGVLIFHVPRRTLAINNDYKYLVSPIPQFEQIPAHILRNERININPIDFQDTMNIQNDILYLRSVVSLETTNDETSLKDNGLEQIVIGTAAIIRKTDNAITADYFIYAPKTLQLTTSVPEPVIQQLIFNSEEYDDPTDLISTRGTIFIYAKNFNA